MQGSEAMITVGMNYNVIGGKQDEFEQKFRSVLRALESADGHVKSGMYRNIDDDCAYLIISEWSAQEKFTEFIRSPTFKQVTDWGKAEILTDRPHHKVYKQ
jgi:heme-degrading monooxygenase HmoA